jgi:uncharacterized protein YodC (DUF2158 family)
VIPQQTEREEGRSNMAIRVGDYVQLFSGGPLMTVRSEESPHEFRCTWDLDGRELDGDTFAEATLRKVKIVPDDDKELQRKREIWRRHVRSAIRTLDLQALNSAPAQVIAILADRMIELEYERFGKI